VSGELRLIARQLEPARLDDVLVQRELDRAVVGRGIVEQLELQLVHRGLDHEVIDVGELAERADRAVRDDRVEGREPGDKLPHYLPGENPFVDEFVKLYHLPLEAVLGNRETLYPEYRKKIKGNYVPPPPCAQSCGQAGNFVLRP